nr:uncharacterized protein LOC128696992 isoform X2 [Cherax quadricarinatus]
MPLKKYRKESLLKKNVFCDLRRLWNRIEFKAQIRKKRDHMSNTNKRKCGTRTKYDMTLSENLPEETIKDHEENTGKKLLRGVRKEINKSSDASITETFKANPSGLKKIIPAQSVLPHKPVFVNVLCLDPKNENGTRVNDDELSADDPLVGVSGKTLFSNTSSINEAADFSGFEDDSPDIPDLLTKILRGRYRKKLVNKQAIRNSPRLRKLGEFTAHIKRKSEFISDTNKRKYETEKVIKRHERNTGKKLFRRAQNKIHKSGDASISKTFTTSPSYLNKMISEESIVPLKPVFVSVLCLDSKNKNGSNYNEDDDDELLTDDPLGGVSGKTLISKTLLMKDTADFSGTEEGSQDIIDPEVKKPRKNYGKKSLVKKKAFRNLPRLRKSLEFVAEIKQKNDANKIKHGAKRRYDMISTRILPEKAIKGHMANTSQELLSGVGMAFKETFSSTITKTFTTNSSGSTITIFTPKEIVPKTLFFDTLNMDSKVKNGGSNNEDDNNELSSDNPLGGMSMKTLIKKTPLTKDTAEFSGIEEESEHNVKMPHKKRRKKKLVRKKTFYNLRRLRKSHEFSAQVKQKNKLISDRNKRKYGTETRNLPEETAKGHMENTGKKLLSRVGKEINESGDASITTTFANSSSGLKEILSTESIPPHKPLFVDVLSLGSKNGNGSSDNEVDNDDLSSGDPLGGMSVKTIFSKTSSLTEDIAETSGTEGNSQGIPDCESKVPPKRIRDVSLVKMKAYSNLPILSKSSEFHAQIKPVSETPSDESDRNLPEKINEGVCRQAQGHLANTSQKLLSEVGMVFKETWSPNFTKALSTNLSGSTITILTPNRTSSKPLFFDTFNMDSKDENGSSNTEGVNELSSDNPLGGMSMKTLIRKTPLTKDTAEFSGTEEDSKYNVKMPHQKRRKQKLVVKKTFYNLRRLRKSREFGAQIKQKNKLISDTNKKKYGVETRNLPEETAKGHMENTGKKLLRRVGKEINKSGDASITTTFANSSSELKEIVPAESILPHKPLFVDVLSLGSKNENGSSDNEVDDEDLSSDDPLGGMSVKTIFSKTDSLTDDIAETSGTEEDSQGISHLETKMPLRRIRDLSLVKMKAYPNLPILSKSSEFSAQIKPLSELTSDASERNLPEKINDGVCHQAQDRLADTSQELLSGVGMEFKKTWSPNFTKTYTTNLSGSTITVLTPRETSYKPLFFDTLNMDSKDENGSSNNVGDNDELSSNSPLGGMSVKTLMNKTPLTKDSAKFSGTEEDSEDDVKVEDEELVQCCEDDIGGSWMSQVIFP